MSKGLVSVIVPIYNTEKYLNRCIESIVGQTYCNLEILLIDDGSTDNCPRICDTWAEKDCRIKVVHQTNAGQSSARNVGLDIARGEYILFVDSDDYISEDHINCLHDLVAMLNVDIAACELLCIDDEGQIFNAPYNDGEIEVLDTASALSELLEGKLLSHGPMAKLYDRKLFAHVRYPVGKIYEDMGTTYRTVLMCNKVAVLRQASYYYVYRYNSTLHCKFTAKEMDALQMEDMMREDILKHYPHLEEKVNCHSFAIYTNLLEKIDKRKNRECYTEIQKRIAQLRSKVIFNNRSARIKHRIFAMIACLGTDMLYAFIKGIFIPIRHAIKKAPM